MWVNHVNSAVSTLKLREAPKRPLELKPTAIFNFLYVASHFWSFLYVASQNGRAAQNKNPSIALEDLEDLKLNGLSKFMLQCYYSQHAKLS